VEIEGKPNESTLRTLDQRALAFRARELRRHASSPFANA
jgi:hypothetical protein